MPFQSYLNPCLRTQLSRGIKESPFTEAEGEVGYHPLIIHALQPLCFIITLDFEREGPWQRQTHNILNPVTDNTPIDCTGERISSDPIPRDMVPDVAL